MTSGCISFGTKVEVEPINLKPVTCAAVAAQEISPGQECVCSWAKQGRMEEEIEGCEKAHSDEEERGIE